MCELDDGEARALRVLNDGETACVWDVSRRHSDRATSRFSLLSRGVAIFDCEVRRPVWRNSAPLRGHLHHAANRRALIDELGVGETGDIACLQAPAEEFAQERASGLRV